MTEIKASHHTIVVERTYNANCARVFAAWCDPQALKRWYVPGDETWTSQILTHDFRIGGRKHLVFGPGGGPQYYEDCRYEDIVDQRRICFSMTVAREDERITTSMVTVELTARGARTEAKVTDQLVILNDGDTAPDRERGWGETLDKLPAELARQEN